MRKLAVVLLVLVVALAVGAQIAEARDRYGPHFGFWGPYVNPYWGPPYLGCNPWNAWCSPSVYVPPLYPLFAPSVVVPQAQERVIIQPPQTYIEQPKQQEQQFWYYCPDSKMYHPYAQSCASAWLKVIPQTTPPPQ